MLAARRWAVRVYFIGYWLYVITAAVWAWFHVPAFGDWWPYVIFQFVYGFFWPVILVPNAFGIRW